MKKIGIIGGLGPESTVDYYKGIIEGFKPTFDESGYPEIAIESCDLRELLSFSETNRWDLVSELLAKKCELLRNAGCHFGAIASNTPHKVFKDIVIKTQLPLVSIVEATAIYAANRGLKKLLLLGTKFTMTSNFYQEVFDKKHIELVVPELESIEYLHEKIFSELEFGIVNSDTKKRFISITSYEAEKHFCDGVIMGCTELPLIIKKHDIAQNYLDTTAIHIQKIIEMCNQ